MSRFKRKSNQVDTTNDKRSKVINDGSDNFEGVDEDDLCDVENYQKYMQNRLKFPENSELKDELVISEDDFNKMHTNVRCQLIREMFGMYKKGKKCSSPYYIKIQLDKDVLKLLRYVSVFYNIFHELLQFSFKGKFKYTEVWDDYMCHYIYSFFCTQFPTPIFKKGRNILKELLNVNEYIRDLTYLGVRGSGKTALNNCLDVLTMMFIRTPDQTMIHFYEYHSQMTFPFDFAMGSYTKQHALLYSAGVFHIFKSWLQLNGLKNMIHKVSTSKESMDRYELPQIVGNEKTKVVVPSLTSLRGSRAMYLIIDELVATKSLQQEVINPIKDKAFTCRGLSSVNAEYLSNTIDLINSSKRVGSKAWYKRPLCDNCKESPLSCVHYMDNQIASSFFKNINDYYTQPVNKRSTFLIQSLGYIPKLNNHSLSQRDIESVFDVSRRINHIKPGRYKFIVSIDPFAHLSSDWSYSLFLVNRQCVYFVGSCQIEGNTDLNSSSTLQSRANVMRKQLSQCVTILTKKGVRNEGVYFWGEGQNSDMLTTSLIKYIMPNHQTAVHYLKQVNLPKDVQDKILKIYVKSGTGTIKTQSQSKKKFINGLKTLIQRKRFFVLKNGYCFNTHHSTLNSWNAILQFILNNWPLYVHPKRKNVDCIMSMLFPMGILSTVLDVINQ